jgi:hypothetical protein
MAEPLEDAVESHDKKVALIIAILALFLAFAEAGAKNAQHFSTEKNIEASDLYNYYQAKKIRATVIETAAGSLEATKTTIADPKAQEAADKQIEAWKAELARFDKDVKNPEDSMDAIVERAKAAGEARESSNQKLEHFEFASGGLQISIVLASAAIITGMTILAWLAGLLGAVSAAIMALGYFAPTLIETVMSKAFGG